MIIKYTVYMAEGPKPILAEFQIRTLAMNLLGDYRAFFKL